MNPVLLRPLAGSERGMEAGVGSPDNKSALICG